MIPASRTARAKAPPPARWPAVTRTFAAPAWRLAAPLSAEDCQVQSMADASPTKWHLAHVTWFFETFLLERFEPGFAPFDPAFRVLFNSYYQGVGAQHPRAQRGLVTRPTLAEVLRYRAHVDERMQALLAARAGDAEIEALVGLGLQHEQQHQELLLTDIKHALSFNPLVIGLCQALADGAGAAAAAALVRLRRRPGRARLRRRRSTARSASTTRRRATARTPRRSRSPRGPRPTATSSPSSTTAATRAPSSGSRWAGTGSQAAAAARRSTGNATATAGSATPCRAGSRSIRTRRSATSATSRPTRSRAGRVRACRPSSSGSSRRAPCARRCSATSPTAARSTRCRRRIRSATSRCRCSATSGSGPQSAYLPYPGYRPLPGAVGEYNGKFMCNQFVLRGGSCATPAGHVRASYRNFFPPDAQWQFSGVRLARDA